MRERTPKWLRLTKSRERRIDRILNEAPHAEPEIAVYPYDGEPFEVLVCEAHSYPVPLEVGVEGVYADYDVRTGQILAANHLRVARRIRVNGAWCLDVYETGGGLIDGRVGEFWYSSHCYRISEDSIRCFDRDNTEERTRFPRRLGPSVDIRWTDDHTAEGPDLGVAGFCVVEIGDRRIEDARVLQVHRFEDEPDELWLDDIYITREGRIALLRVYLSKKPDRWDENDLEDSGPWDAPGVARLTYNGVEYVHWFDRLSGLSLGINPRTT